MSLLMVGISGVQTNEYAWRYVNDVSKGHGGVQIDLLVDRADGVIDLCEMKYSSSEYVITGVAHNSEWNEIQNEITMDDLFAV